VAGRNDLNCPGRSGRENSLDVALEAPLNGCVVFPSTRMQALIVTDTLEGNSTRVQLPFGAATGWPRFLVTRVTRYAESAILTRTRASPNISSSPDWIRTPRAPAGTPIVLPFRTMAVP
jgi:hypothetical protein